MASIEKRRILEIETQLRKLGTVHRRVLDEWKAYHRLKGDIEELSKILRDERDSLNQGQLMFPVEQSKRLTG